MKNAMALLRDVIGIKQLDSSEAAEDSQKSQRRVKNRREPGRPENTNCAPPEKASPDNQPGPETWL